MTGNYGIGHNRYSTTGDNTLRNIQPFFADTNAGGIGVAHNGNLTNSITLRNKLVQDGAIFHTTSDTETIVQLIAKSKRNKTIDKVIDAIFQIQGGYALVQYTSADEDASRASRVSRVSRASRASRMKARSSHQKIFS